MAIGNSQQDIRIRIKLFGSKEPNPTEYKFVSAKLLGVLIKQNLNFLIIMELRLDPEGKKQENCNIFKYIFQK